MRVLAIVPARGGSKGVSGKNIRLLAGLPLIAWTLRAAAAAQLLDRVIVSTDSDEIAQVSRELGAEVPFMRPPDLAKDHSSVVEALRYTLKTLHEREDYIPDALVMLNPTSPFRTSSDIDEAVALLEDTVEAVVSVTPEKVFTWTHHGDYWAPDYDNHANRQTIASRFRANGLVYVFWRKTIFTYDNLAGKRNKVLIVPYPRSLDIDTPEDFLIAEALAPLYLPGGDAQ